jgi:hypothetical protein
MSSRDSGENSNTLNLSANQTFSGKPTDVSGFTKCGVSVLCDQEITLFIYQSMTGTIVDKVDTYVVPAVIKPTQPYTEFTPQKRAVEMNYRFVWITAKNANETATTYCRIQTQLYNAGFLEAEHDRVEIWGKTAGEVKKPILVDDAGKLMTSTEITGLTLTPDDDGVGVYGSSDGANRVILKTDADGKLETIAEITQLTLTADDDAVAVYGSSDGTNRVILKTDAGGKLETSTEITGLTLTADDDAVAVYGSSDGTDRVILKTDVNGRLETSTEITGLTLTPDDDGIAVYGSDGTDLIVLKTDNNGKLETTSVVSGAVSVSNFPATQAVSGEINVGNFPATQAVSGSVNVGNFPATQVVNDTIGNPLLASLNVNANKASLTDLQISSSTAVSGGADVGLPLDLGVDENRYRNVVFRGEVDVSVNTSPKLIMAYSDDNTTYHSDGTFCSFYKKSAVAYEFCFQRSNIGLRYVKLMAENNTTLTYLKSTMSKY